MEAERWVAKETVFTSIKRIFDEHASANHFQNMVKEIMINISLYNPFKRMV
jgi:hypothetical protein